MGRMPDYTITNLNDVEDVAAARGLSFGIVRFPREALGCEQTGVAHTQYFPGQRQPFGHRHTDAEEVYYVISGSGRVKLDGGVHDLRAKDLLRVAPHVMRSFEGGPDGLELLAFGARHAGDGEVVQGYWEQ
jgi:mannose-6-phosphate isomerase-like protein (cupin superfamily)